MRVIGLVFLLVVVFFMGFYIYDNQTNDPKLKELSEIDLQTLNDYRQKLANGEISITEFNAIKDQLYYKIDINVKRIQDIKTIIECYTQTKDFICATITIKTNSNTIIEETTTIDITELKEVTTTDEQGITTTEIQNVTTTIVIPKVSDANITYLDKQTGDFMVCIQGHQCQIEAQVELYDINENYVEPPYGYQLTITCEFRDYCNEISSISTNAGTVTDGGGGIKYIWTTDTTDSLGDYELILNIRSAVNDIDGLPINLEKRITLVLIS